MLSKIAYPASLLLLSILVIHCKKDEKAKPNSSAAVKTAVDVPSPDKAAADKAAADKAAADKAEAEKLPAASPDPSLVAKSVYAGTWNGTCVSNSLAKTVSLSKYLITDQSLTITQIFYDATDKSCVKPLQTYTVEATFKAGKNLTEPAGAQEIDMSVTAAKIVLHNTALVTKYNNAGLCGVKTWKIDEALDVRKTGCGTAALYDIFKLEGNKLSIGMSSAQLDGTTLEKRAKQLDVNTLTKE
ncbi:MAG: hypothetical protein NTX25_10335 [Proteobacteria bacterium]|nr:hypothetical protein [Pseudomonadota bacterium]